MADEHRNAVMQLAPHRFADIYVWDIPDDFNYCEPELVEIIRERLKTDDRPRAYATR